MYSEQDEQYRGKIFWQNFEDFRLCAPASKAIKATEVFTQYAACDRSFQESGILPLHVAARMAEALGVTLDSMLAPALGAVRVLEARIKHREAEIERLDAALAEAELKFKIITGARHA